MTYQLYLGDCLDFMRTLDAGSVDAIVTDPPYGLGFMGKDWDHGVPGVHFWQEAYRVAKPGAHLLAFGGTRTFHRLAVAIEDAGWEIRDDIATLGSMDDKQRNFFLSLDVDQQQAFLDAFASADMLLWVYGQGFPKSHDVSKAIDREAGVEREVIGGYMHGGTRQSGIKGKDLGQVWHDETSPSTPAAAEWEGWGTALKPAWEPIIVARKPLEGTVAQNVQRYGTGAINVDACRIETGDDISGGTYGGVFSASRNPDGTLCKAIGSGDKGRWPANLIHDGSPEVLAGFPMTSSGGKSGLKMDRWTANGRAGIAIETPSPRDADTGSAARFFYCAKASKKDRDEGLEELQLRDASIGDQRPSGSMSQRIHTDEGRPDTKGRNHHPTVKPTSLMRYLCRLVTPPNGIILDPFMGSGSTGKAAMLDGFNFIGCEINAEYIAIAERRIKDAAAQPPLFHLDEPRIEATQAAML